MDVQKLNMYREVNPATSKGLALMDGGRFTFVPESTLHVKKSVGFRNEDVYCVAPVTLQTQTLQNYDFWAVGTNCCSGHGADFRCGEYGNPHAHSGLRVLRNDARDFFRLAVSQAEATYNISAAHPIFFTWLQDPSIELDAYQEATAGGLTVGLFGYFIAQLVLTVLAALGFSSSPVLLSAP